MDITKIAAAMLQFKTELETQGVVVTGVEIANTMQEHSLVHAAQPLLIGAGVSEVSIYGVTIKVRASS